MSSDSATHVDERLTHLFVQWRTTADADRLASVILAPRTWLGPEVEPAPPGLRRHHTDLRLRVGDRPSIVTFRKAAYVDLGPLQSLGDGWQVEVQWRASTLAPLFPVFSGTIVARGDELTVSGWYDPAKTAFFFVTLPEALPIAVIRRFIDWFTDFGIPVGGVIVNMVIDSTQTKGTGEGGEFVRNRIAMQQGYLREIGETFDGDVRAVVPLLDSDIRGVAALQEAGRRLFT
jgi:hypothetical protein